MARLAGLLTLLILLAAPPAGARTPLHAQKGIFADLQDLPPAQLRAQLRVYGSLGVRWARFQLVWSQVQPLGPGTFAWGQFDRVVAGLRRHHIRALPVLGSTPAWARSAGCVSVSCGPADPSAFGAFAGAATRHFARRGVHHWEIFNEPNSAIFWSPQPDVGAYTAALRAAGGAIHAADPAATVVTGGMAPARTTAGGWISPVEFLAGIYADGGREAFDAVGQHPYTWPDLPPLRGIDSAWFQMAGTRPSLRSIMRAHGDAGKRIWATEFGSTTTPGSARGVTEARQARMLRTGWRLWQRLPFAGPMIVYTYADRGEDPSDLEDHFGLFRTDGSPKPAVGAFRSLR